MDFTDQTLIVTGANSGIGKAAAEVLAKQGARLVLGARRSEPLDSVAHEIEKKGGHAIAVAGDIGDPDYAAKLVKAAEDHFGSLNGAFNNAGIVGDLAAAENMSLSTWDDVLRTNLTSAFLAAKVQIPALKRAGSGTLLFTSSFVGYSNGGLPGMGAYAASKAGLIGLVQSLAADHGKDNIRVNAILPGGTMTPMAGDDPDIHTYISGKHALGRLAHPAEIARTALFLLSENASFVTGSAMLADGGVSVRFD